MGFTAKQMAFLVGALGLVSFILGILAENKKPASGTPIPGKGVVICNYPSDPSIVLGSLSVVFLVAATAVGFLSLFYPYKGQSIPQFILFKDSTFAVFFHITVFTTGLGAALLLWPVIQEGHHLNNKVHHDPNTTCPTAKTGLFGGGAFLSLDSALLWLLTLMLATNAREDYFDDAQTSYNDGRHSQAIAFGT